MSHFIFKDIHSDDMKVLVQKLPPITLPPKRYTIKEFGGRDRTDIQMQGYKAYEKVISIGFRENNMDKINNWLNGSGKLILSNEPNKYYQAAILEQINYERALRFKTADIPFYVQPYKLSVEDEVTEQLNIYNSGNIDSLPLITIYGNGPVTLLVNGIEVCRFLYINEYVSIDSDIPEAYKGITLQNRVMIGEFPRLKPGINILSYRGNVTKIVTEVRSRWV